MPALHAVLLSLHSIWRWALLAAGLAAVVSAFMGWFGRRPFGKTDRQLGQLYSVSLDIQVLLGLALWALDETTGALAAPSLQFFAFVHPFAMVFALGIAHAGRVLSRRAARGGPSGAIAEAAPGASLPLPGSPGGDDVPAYRYAALFYLASLLIILAFIPWDRLAH
jgi:hypothetical protein